MREDANTTVLHSNSRTNETRTGRTLTSTRPPITLERMVCTRNASALHLAPRAFGTTVCTSSKTGCARSTYVSASKLSASARRETASNLSLQSPTTTAYFLHVGLVRIVNHEFWENANKGGEREKAQREAIIQTTIYGYLRRVDLVFNEIRKLQRCPQAILAHYCIKNGASHV